MAQLQKNKNVLFFAISICFIAIVYFIKNNYYDFYKVDGNSMNNTLYNQNIVLINKNFKIKRFDIVIIKKDNQLLIKRIIGLPGETIEYKDDSLYINGCIIDDIYKIGITGDIEPLKIDDNSYYIMGDNREKSTDSRIYGIVSVDKIVGVAKYIIIPKLKKI